MAFFDAPPPPPPRLPPQPKRPEWLGPPEGWLGGFVPLRLLVARGPEMLITLGSMRAYPNGVELELQVITRQPRSGIRSIDGGEEGLRLGVAFADGRKWQGVYQGQPWKESPPGPMLMQRGASGRSHEYSQEL